MSHKPIIAYAVILYFLLVTQSTSGQFINFKTDKYWADIGLGSFNTFKYSNGIHENIGINLLKKEFYIKSNFNMTMNSKSCRQYHLRKTYMHSTY